MVVLGMISGTSADGIENAVLELFGIPPRLEWRLLFLEHIPFDSELRNEIFACFRPESGTAQKLVLNMFSIGVIIKQEKTCGNQMIGREAGNKKLIAREQRLTAEACGITEKEVKALQECHPICYCGPYAADRT